MFLSKILHLDFKFSLAYLYFSTKFSLCLNYWLNKLEFLATCLASLCAKSQINLLCISFLHKKTIIVGFSSHINLTSDFAPSWERIYHQVSDLIKVEIERTKTEAKSTFTITEQDIKSSTRLINC